LLAKRDSDLAAAFQLYERAADLGAPPRALLAAAQLAEGASQRDLADKYIERLKTSAPGSPEAEAARALQEARGAAKENGK
jgi:Tfp pilus assembly protein PilF